MPQVIQSAIGCNEVSSHIIVRELYNREKKSVNPQVLVQQTSIYTNPILFSPHSYQIPPDFTSNLYTYDKLQ